MAAQPVFSPVLLLLFLLLLFLVIRGLNRGRRMRSLTLERNQHRHPVVRLVCGLLALVLVGAVTFFTWKATSPGATLGPGPGLLIPAPLTLTEAPATERDETDEAQPGISEPQRLIYTLLVVANDGEAMVPIEGTSVIIEWPQDRSKNIVIESELPGGGTQAEIAIDSFRRDHRGELVASSRQRISYRMNDRAGSRSGGDLDLGKVNQYHLGGRPRFGRAPLSVVPEVIGGNLYLLWSLTQADAGEPVEVDAAEWLRHHADGLMESRRDRDFHTMRTLQGQPNGVAMLRYTGPASWLLLLAAILVSQVFRRRGPAFAAAMAFMVLLAISLDRTMIERHAALLQDTSMDDAGRNRVAQRINQSFFHAGRVEQILTVARED